VSLLTSLISYWKLDEASGTRVDSHGTNDLTDNGSVASTSGVIGNAADFDSDSLSHANNSDLQTGDIDFSISFWFQVKAHGFYCYLLSKESGSEREYGLYFDGNGGSSLDLVWEGFGYAGGGNPFSLHWSAPIGTGSWHHCVVWHDSVANQVGICIDAGTPVTASLSTGVYASSAPFTVGNHGSDNRYFYGYADEVGFWKRVLTSQERTDLYGGGAGLPYSSFGGGGGTDGTATPSTLNTTWASVSPALTGSATALPASLDALWQVRTTVVTGTAVIAQGSPVSATWNVEASSASSGQIVTPATCNVTWACNAAVAVGSASCLPPANSLIFAVPTPVLTANASLTTSTLGVVWASQAPTVTGEQNVLTAGTITSSGHTDTTAALSCTAAVNGTTPYAYQWYRSTSSGFTPGAGNILSGETSLTLADTGLTASTNYYYVLKVTDNDSNVAYATEFNVLTDSAPGVGGVGSFRATTGAGI